MSEDSNGNRSDDPSGCHQGTSFSWWGFILMVVALLLLSVSYAVHSHQSRPLSLNYQTFKEEVERGNIATKEGANDVPLELYRSDTSREEYILGYLTEWPKSGLDTLVSDAQAGGPYRFKVQISLEFQKEELNKLLTDHKLSITSKREGMWTSPLMSLLPMGLILGGMLILGIICMLVWLILKRRMKKERAP